MARRWIALVVLTLVALACTSPTLPLPPPTLPTVTTGTAPDTYHLRSDKGGLPNALVIAVNRDATLPAPDRVTGTIADPEGSWEMDVKGKAGDVLDISQDDGVMRSPTTGVTLPAR